jgi:GntR family transcriptional regulator/MocR family aminotransferase
VLLALNLVRDRQETLQRQIFAQISGAILAGRLLPGMELPPSRVLASQYGLSRNTVVQAYQWLAAEGYVETQRSARTIISENLPEECLSAGRLPSLDGDKAAPRLQKTEVVFRGRRPVLPDAGLQRKQIDFWPGRPNPKLFPVQLVRKLALIDRMATAGRELTEYGDAFGMPALREAIALHLETARGLISTPEQVVITSGIQEALNIVSRLFVNEGTQVLVENPCYRSAALVFESYGAKLFPLDVDGQGARLDALGAACAPLAYVTPSHQFPTGATMSLDRRLKLLEWTHNSGAYVIEDDYDSDYRFSGPPLTALAGLDPGHSVIYLGTFSKSIGAGIRTGFMVLPPQLVETARTIKILLNFGHPWFEQYLLGDFMTTRAYQHHLRRIRRAYREVRDTLMEELRAAFGNLDLWGVESGMHIMWRLPRHFPNVKDFVERTASYGVRIHSLESGGAHDMGSPYANDSILLGYSSLSREEIRTAVLAMANAVQDLTAGRLPAKHQIDRVILDACQSNGAPSRIPRRRFPQRIALSQQGRGKRRGAAMRARAPRGGS